METTRICPSCQKPLPPDVPLGLCPECLIKSGFNTGTDPGNPGKESSFVPPPVEELRKLFPQLEILELIGKGGMGAVYKARQMALDRLVALKILPPGAADDAGFAERFNREARALARLNHPHIVAVHDFGQTGGQPYLVMEFVDGPNLRQVEQAGRLTPEQALEIVPQICEALQFAHNEGVVHRDIKPENILLDKKGRVKITDFGIAKIIGVPAGKISLTGAKDVLGTPHYMAPEQVEKPSTVDHRADIYSLGVVFYELLTGELPLGKFQPPSKKVQVDVRLDEVVLHTLEKEPERRYQQASQVKSDVETIAATAAKSEVRSPKSEARLEFLERRRRNMLLYGFWVSVMGLPITLALRMPYLSLLAVAGIFIGGFKLGWFTREGWQQLRLSLAKKGLGRTVMVEDTASRWAQVACFVAALLVLVLGMRALSQFDLRPHELFFGVLLVLVLTLVMVVAGLLIGSVPASRCRPTTPAAPAGSQAGSLPAAVQQAVHAPAGWLVATGILNWVAIPLVFIVTMGIVAGSDLDQRWALFLPLSAMLLSSVMIVAGLKMKRLEAYPLAIIGSVLAILVMPGNIIGLPVGIWCLVVLCRREVREAFNGKLPPDLLASGAAAGAPMPRPDRFWRRFAVAIALVLLALILIPVGAILLSITLPALHKARERARIVQGEVISEVPITPPMSVSFSPVQEVILNDLDEARGNEALSFASGQLLSLPADFGQQAAEARAVWMDSNRVDLLVDYARDRWALLGRGLRFRDLHIAAWDAPHLGWGGQWPDTEVLEMREAREVTLYLLPTNAQPPLTFAFLTANGDHGVLKITGLFANDPRGVKLRYKLAQLPGGGGGGGGVASAAPERVTSEFGPVIERDLSGESSLSDCFLDVDTGRVLSAPKELVEALKATGQVGPNLPPVTSIADWARTNEVDFLLRPGETRLLLLGGVTVLSIRSFDAHTATEIVRLTDHIAQTMVAQDDPAFHMACDFGTAEARAGSWLFRTREGRQGVLQITGLTEKPPGVKLRYKLTQLASGGGGGGRAIAASPDLVNVDADAVNVIVPNRYLAAALAGMELAAEKIKDAAARGQLSGQADVFNHFNKLCDQLQGKNQNSAPTPQDWGIHEADEFRVITDSVAALEDASERMRDIARSTRQSKAEREALLKEEANKFVSRYAEFKARLRSATRSGGMGAADQNAQRKFVRLVADKTALTFEGRPTRWNEVGALLANVPDRKNTVLEFAITSDQITVAQQNEWFQKASALARQHGFEYASFIGIHPLGSKGTSTVFAQAKAGEYCVELTNGVTAEILALTSTPRAPLPWWQPNGTLLGEAPSDPIGELSNWCPDGRSAVEFAVIIGGSGEIAAEQLQVLIFEPPPQYVAWAANTDRLLDSAPVVDFRTRPGGSTSRFGLAVVGFRTAPESLTCRIGLAEGEWQRVATWDAAGTLLSNETGGPLQLVRSGDEHTTCAKLAHRVDPNRFAVRLAARLKDGQYKIARVCRTDYGGTEEARICALIQGMQDADVVAYELYRVPLRWAAIPAIATKPTVPPLQVAPGTSSQQSPATFGPVTTLSVSGEGDARRRFIDFETGRQFAASEFFGPKAEPSPEETQKWWKDNSIDAMGDTSPAVLGLVGLDMVAVPVPLHEWDMIPARLDYYLAAAKPGTPVTMSAKGDLPATYVIQTREGGRGLLQITGFSGATPDTRSVMIRYKLVQSLNKSNRLSRLLSDPERSRALALFNDIEDFGHEFEAAFASTNLAAAETGVRRLLSLLTNFNTTVKGTDYQFPPALLEAIAKVRHALQEGDWSKARLLARHNEEYAREFRRIGGEMADLARERNAMQSPPTNQVTARKLAAEKVVVEDLALRMLAAIRDKEDDVLQSLAVDRIKDWRASLPHFAFEARERFQQMRGRPFNLLPTESLVEGDYAVVKCDDPKAANQIYLVLQFVRTEHGWKNWSLRNSPPATPLAEHLKQRPPDGSAGTAKPNR